MVCPLPFRKVEASKNSKVMLDCEEIVSGEYEDGKPFRVVQSGNRNVITIIADGFYNHVLMTDIVERVLTQSAEKEKG